VFLFANLPQLPFVAVGAGEISWIVLSKPLVSFAGRNDAKVQASGRRVYDVCRARPSPAQSLSLHQGVPVFVFRHESLTTHANLFSQGIYYQAEIQGQTITWIVPYRFNTVVGNDVDYKVMSNFLLLYTTMLTFVNFKLYTSMNLKYPPTPHLPKAQRGQGKERRGH
jgi:hypothetical protein